MSPEAIKATLIAKALHQMANASANLQITAAEMQLDVLKGGHRTDLDESAAFFRRRYETAEATLDSLLDPIPIPDLKRD